MKIGVLGSGDVAKALASGFVNTAIKSCSVHATPPSWRTGWCSMGGHKPATCRCREICGTRGSRSQGDGGARRGSRSRTRRARR